MFVTDYADIRRPVPVYTESDKQGDGKDFSPIPVLVPIRPAMGQFLHGEAHNVRDQQESSDNVVEKKWNDRQEEADSLQGSP